ncbi:hypothetical protein [Salinicoccus roseus]|uniref:hypothetical protein n=1 Tax=Salinicoccus roseus TaxID=45670 RepID=UPI003DA0C556
MELESERTDGIGFMRLHRQEGGVFHPADRLRSCAALRAIYFEVAVDTLQLSGHPACQHECFGVSRMVMMIVG